MHDLVRRLLPICRSITGEGVRETLGILSENLPTPMNIEEVPSGTAAFDWNVPKEWAIREAWIEDENGNRIVDFAQHNLHIVGYSVPVDSWVTLQELQERLYSLEDQPDAIPFVTSYYKEHWGFCLAHSERVKLKEGNYRVFIDSELKDGHLTYGEWILPGETEEEVFISSYICHPSMANNELSGPVVATWIAKWLATQPRRYTYRIVFVPETIGSIVYLSRYRELLRERVVAGFNLSCIGDDRNYSYLASRYESTMADRVAQNVLKSHHPGYKKYSFLERGSDERQYCSPGVDLPLVTLCRTRFGEYSEYHTSLDNLDVVTPDGLSGGFDLVSECLEVLEKNRTYQATCYGEPQLGKRGLYPSLSTKGHEPFAKMLIDLLAYADGSNDLIGISNIIGNPVSDLWPVAERLVEEGLLEELEK